MTFPQSSICKTVVKVYYTQMIQKASDLSKTDFITTGLFTDKVSGGLPRGKIFELYGDSGLGKSTLALQMVASAQKQGYKCGWADFEWYFDPQYAEAMGIDINKLDIVREDTAEEGLDQLEEAISKGKYDLFVLDAVGALHSRQEAEKGVGDKVIGVQASLTSRFLRKIVPILFRTNTCLLAINHSFVDLMSGAIKTSGGKKMEYHRSISIRLKKKHGVVLKQGDRVVGYSIIAECKRNKVLNTEGMEAEGQLILGQGFNKQFDLLEAALEKGIITKTGNSYFFAENKIGTISKLREWIKVEENTDLIKNTLSKGV